MTKGIDPKKLVQARKLALVFSILGIMPLEVFIPAVSAIWDHKLFVFNILSLYFITYVIVLTGSLRVLWICDRRTLQALKITNFKIGQVGKMFVSAIEWARMWTYKESWYFPWKLIYFLILVLLGFLPFFVKFGIGLCVLRNTKLSYLCLILGTLLRSYCLVYLGADVFDWLFGS